MKAAETLEAALGIHPEAVDARAGAILLAEGLRDLRKIREAHYSNEPT